MKLVWLALVAAVASAQPSLDARRLLQDTFDAATTPDTWFVEARLVADTASDFHSMHRAESLKSWRSGQDWRLESRDDASRRPYLWLKNGTQTWRTRDPWSLYETRQVRPDLRAPVYFRWENFPAVLDSAVLAGREPVQFEGRPVECIVIRSKTSVSLQTFYIDPSRKMLLREVWERTLPCNSFRSTATFSYIRIERSLPIDPALFTFTPPPGAVQGELPAPDVQGFYRPGGGVSEPAPISKADPGYTSLAIEAGIEGMARVWVVVTPFGLPGRMRVLRGLGAGLDEKALEAVRQWCSNRAGKKVSQCRSPRRQR